MHLRLPSVLSQLARPANWLEQSQNSILSAATIITAANIISSLSSLITTRYMISVFFDSASSQQAYEALRLAFQVPDLVFQLVVLGALSAAFIPIFTRYKKDDLSKAFKMSSIMMLSLIHI